MRCGTTLGLLGPRKWRGRQGNPRSESQLNKHPRGRIHVQPEVRLPANNVATPAAAVQGRLRRTSLPTRCSTSSRHSDRRKPVAARGSNDRLATQEDPALQCAEVNVLQRNSSSGREEGPVAIASSALAESLRGVKDGAEERIRPSQFCRVPECHKRAGFIGAYAIAQDRRSCLITASSKEFVIKP